jgi:hypothetical protein
LVGKVAARLNQLVRWWSIARLRGVDRLSFRFQGVTCLTGKHDLPGRGRQTA